MVSTIFNNTAVTIVIKTAKTRLVRFMFRKIIKNFFHFKFDKYIYLNTLNVRKKLKETSLLLLSGSEFW